MVGAARQVSEESKRSQRSFLNPTGVTADTPPPKARGPFLEIAVFAVFVLLKAIHPVAIDASKSVDASGKPVILYKAGSTIVTKDFIIAFLSLAFCYAKGGKKEFLGIFQVTPFLLFTLNGFLYALGDYLEMASMGTLSGAAYQILMQSQIFLTAALMMVVKGLYQTRLQWLLMVILMCSMSCYMIITTSESSGGSIPLFGVMLALLKVFESAFAAVISDKYMKVYKDEPTHVQIARIYCLRPFFILLLSFLKYSPTDFFSGFYYGWNGATCVVTTSFVLKSVCTLYLLAFLDSILKNIGESFAILVIYSYDILAPWTGKSFDTATFLTVMCVVAACAAYVDSKAPIEKAAKFDKEQEETQLKESVTGA